MVQPTAEKIKLWQGPAILSYGFRPFFLGGALWAAFAMVLWIMALSGQIELPTTLDPVSWHAHAFLFGYTSAIIAGFLLTAVPSWTGRLPIVGWYLAGLIGLWGAGRIAVLFSAFLPFESVVVIDLAFPVVFALVILREIVAGKNWRNLIILLLLGLFTLADLGFHLAGLYGPYAAQGYGLRLGLASVLLMIAVIGGRIIPSFTRNWLTREGYKQMPVPPMQLLDKLVLIFSLPVFLMWIIQPEALVTGGLMLLMGVGHAVRMARWKGLVTFAQPLVTILHIAYACLPLGALAMATAIFQEDVIPASAAQHIWMAGALGGMTLAVMTRASLGHTGRALQAGAGTVIIYLALIASTCLRFAAGFWPEEILYHLAGGLWLLAFLGFAIFYGPILLSPRK